MEMVKMLKIRIYPDKKDESLLIDSMHAYILQTFAMNVVQVSFLLGHAQLETIMRYLDISKDEKLKAMATLESEKQSSVPKKWRSSGASLKKLCGFEYSKGRAAAYYGYTIENRDEKFELHRYTGLMADNPVPLWHIHGTAFKRKSMVIGHITVSFWQRLLTGQQKLYGNTWDA